MKGRKPTPTAILKLRGSRRVKGRTHEARAPEGVPECPAELADEARDEWHRMIAILGEMKVLSLAEQFMLAECCQVWADMRAIRRRIAQQGETTKNKYGRRIHPESHRLDTLRAQWIRMLTEFGLSPASRSKAARVEKDVGKSELEKMLGG